MKKTISAFIAAAMALIIGISLCACGENTPAQEEYESSRSGSVRHIIHNQKPEEGIELEEPVSKDAATVFNNGDTGFGFIFELPTHPRLEWDDPLKTNIEGIYGAEGGYSFYREVDQTYALRLFFSKEYDLNDFLKFYMSQPYKTYAIPYAGYELVVLPEYREVYVTYQKDGVNYFLSFWDLEFARDILDAFGLEVESMENRIVDKVLKIVTSDRFGREVAFPKGLYVGDFSAYEDSRYGTVAACEAFDGDDWDKGIYFVVSDGLTAKADAEDWANANELEAPAPSTYRGVEIYRICDLIIFGYQNDGLNYVVEVWNEETLDSWLDFFGEYLENLEPLKTAEE